MIKFWLYRLYRQIIRNYQFSKKHEFEKRIIKRWEKFWLNPHDKDQIQKKFFSEDSMTRWKDIENWQRRLSNKHNAKEFAKKLHCKVAKVYWQGRIKEFKNFEISRLPEHFIIKPVRGYGSKNVFVIADKLNLFDGKIYSNSQLRNEILKLLEMGHEVIIEEFLSDEKGRFKVPIDYRFYTFNGEVLFIQMDMRKSFEKDQVSFYDKDWNLIKKRILEDAVTHKVDPKPACLEEMICQVRKLSANYELFVRIDFYATQNGAVFGEFTPTPRKGKSLTKYGNKVLIKAWDRYCKGMI